MTIENQRFIKIRQINGFEGGKKDLQRLHKVN
jgi:hypothetical protein